MVDDNDLDRELTCIVLRPHFEVSAFDTPDAALAALDSTVCAILSDYNMPRKDGLWLLSQVAQRVPHARRMLMTGCVDDACNAALKASLAHRAFDKPVQASDVVHTVEQAVEAAAATPDRD